MKKSFAIVCLITICNTVIAQIPSGYYNATINKSCSTLKTQLKTIITTGNTPQSYADLWTQYLVSDIKPREVGSGSANVIWDIYSDNPVGTDPYNFTPGTSSGGQQDQGSGGSSEGQYYNREHSVPLSWFNGSTGSNGPATDYLHIFPTDKKVNNVRSNNIYGEVATASFTSLNGSKLGTSSIAGFTGSVFEPIDSFKGDVARAFLYFVTRYESDIPTFSSNTDATQSFDNNTFPSVKIEYLKLMIKWHNLDPVSKKEIDRNNAAYTFQGNRNPYIDSPQFVNKVWNNTCPGLAALPVDIVFFAGKLRGTKIDLTWEVANEINFSYYNVERSFNGSNYETIATINAAGKNNYSYTDNIENYTGRRIYYRLKKVDKDGKYSFSKIFTIHVPLNIQFTVYPNPVKEVLTIKFNTKLNNADLQICDMAGKIVLTQKVNAENNSLIYLPIQQLLQGSYTVKIINNGETSVKKIQVIK